MSVAGAPILIRSEIVLEDLGLNPNGRKVGDGVETHFGLNGNAGEGVAFGDVTGNRRIDFKLLLHLAGGFQPSDFLLWNTPLFQSLRRRVEQGCCAG